jgi:hypothetical protein
MSKDLRDYANTTNKRLVIGAVAILFVVGLGLIAWLYGWSAALTGFICMLGGLGLVGLVALIFFFIGLIVKKNRD